MLKKKRIVDEVIYNQRRKVTMLISKVFLILKSIQRRLTKEAGIENNRKALVDKIQQWARMEFEKFDRTRVNLARNCK